jgi:hypothetical protein
VLNVHSTVTLRTGAWDLRPVKNTSMRIDVSYSRSTLRRTAGKPPLYNIGHHDKISEEYVVPLSHKADYALKA